MMTDVRPSRAPDALAPDAPHAPDPTAVIPSPGSPPDSGAVAGDATGRPPARLLVTVGLLLGLALAVRIGYVLHTTNYVAKIDAHSYDFLARSLAAGNGWPGHAFGWAWRAPGYPYLLASIYWLVGIPHGADPNLTAVRIVQAVIGTITVGLIGLLARELWGRKAMVVALALAAVSLPLTVVGEALMSESLFTPLALAATVCALRSRRASRRYAWVLAAAVLTGLASLTRANGVILLPGLVALVWSGGSGRWRLLAPLLLVLVTAAVIAPWTIRNESKLHDFVLVTDETGQTLAGTYNNLSAKRDWGWTLNPPGYQTINFNPHLTPPQRDRKATSAVLTFIGRHPYSVPEVAFWNTVRLLDLTGRRASRTTARTDVDATAGVADAMVYEFWAFGALAIIGLLARATRGTPKSLWLVPLGLWLSVALVTTGTPRFRSALEPFVLVLAAAGLLAVSSAVTRRRSPRGPANPTT